MTVSLQIRACQVGACDGRVPPHLVHAGMCLSHYLDQVFSRVSNALESRRKGKTLDVRTVQWLQHQGDFVVQLLSSHNRDLSAEQRVRLMELILCLANVHEYSDRNPGPRTW